MAKISVRYFTRRRRKDGTERFFWQPDKNLRDAGWKLHRLAANYNEAIAQAEALNIEVDEWRAGARKEPSTNIAGSLDAIIAAYKKSQKYKSLGARTLRDYDACLRKISHWAGDEAAAVISPKMVQDLYQELKPASHRQADYVIQVLRLLYNFAGKNELVPEGKNPARQPELTYKAPKGKLWTPAAVAAFVKKADAMNYFSVGTAVMLNEWIGQRKGDIITLPQGAYKNGIITVGAQAKTGNEVPPLDLNVFAPALVVRLDEQLRRNQARTKPGHTLIQQEDGKAFVETHFTHVVRRIRKEAEHDEPELKDMIFLHLRHTAITRMAEASATVQEIAAISGHSLNQVEDIIDRYNVRTKKLADNAMQKRANAERK